MGCGRLAVQLLHGGFSGSRVLQVQPFAPLADGGATGEPSVAKLDGRAEASEERRAMALIGPELGENTCRAISAASAGARARREILHRLAVRRPGGHDLRVLGVEAEDPAP